MAALPTTQKEVTNAWLYLLIIPLIGLLIFAFINIYPVVVVNSTATENKSQVASVSTTVGTISVKVECNPLPQGPNGENLFNWIITVIVDGNPRGSPHHSIEQMGKCFKDDWIDYSRNESLRESIFEALKKAFDSSVQNGSVRRAQLIVHAQKLARILTGG